MWLRDVSDRLSGWSLTAALAFWLSAVVALLIIHLWGNWPGAIPAAGEGVPWATRLSDAGTPDARSRPSASRGRRNEPRREALAAVEDQRGRAVLTGPSGEASGTRVPRAVGREIE